MKEITAKELEQKLVAGENLNIIDVREDEEVAMGKIPGAKHIPLGQIPERLDELDKDEHYYMVCRSGGRSGNACQFLMQNGYNVTNMIGGMLDWEGEME
ncbi:rhodanese-like domain-containing protein [Ornithinibacillus scapharcae]|uniref:rhodanese-like domain-containing protein n=1 Tax=Ornithinibacillus scapharcae TaxID=1147159 RepID=UPI000225B633|nr:rhodanese-like domain-containing protein [Ornithinibacillus scapharcae]